MHEKDLIRLRQKAERAVSDMKNGELKVAAFSTILAKLLSDFDDDAARTDSDEAQLEQRRVATPTANSLPKRILAIKREGFFKTQRTLNEVREVLGSRGWHYPITSFSGAMQALTRRREFRRERLEEENKRIWKYGNP